MAWENPIFVITALLSGVITSILAQVALKRRFVPGAKQFGLLMLACALWSLAYALELGSQALSVKLFWVRIEYVGIAVVPLAWLAFVLAYSGRGNWLTRLRLFWLSLPPAAMILMSVSNHVLHLVWDQAELVTSGSYRFLYLHHTTGFYAFVVYSNLLLLAGTGLILRLAIGSSRLQRRQVVLVVLGTLVSWLGNMLYVGNLNPIPGLDWTPFGFTISGFIFGLALFRYRLLDIHPVARQAILESMQEGVVILDDRFRILECNPAAEQLLDLKTATLFGNTLPDYLPGLTTMPDWIEAAIQSELELELQNREARIILEIRASRLDHGQIDPMGYLVLIRDNTRARQSERSLSESEERFRRLAEASLEGIIFSENGIIRDLNQQVTSLVGYEGMAQELVGRNILEFVVQADHQKVIQAIQTEYEGSYSIRLVHRCGHLVPVEVRGKAFQMEDRAVRVSVVQDRTDQFRFQESLQRRDDILDAVSFVAGALLKDLDWQTVIQEVLAGLGQSAGASRAYLFELDQHNDSQRLYFSQRFEWVNEGISAQIENPDLQGFSFRESGFLDWESRLLDGKPISGLVKDFPNAMAEFLADEEILALAIVPIFASKQLWGFLGFDECVTERLWSEGEIEALKAAANTIGAAIQRQEIESALLKSEQRYRTLVDAARDVIFTLTSRGRISSLNPAFEEITGWQASDWLGKSFVRLIDPSDLPIAQQVIRQVQQGDSLPVFDACVRTRSGEPVIMEFKAVAEGENGKLKEVHGVARDITVRVQTERSLQQRMEELAALYETSLEINAQRDLSTLLQAIVNRACRLTGAALGGIYLLRSSGRELILVVSHHLPDHFLGITQNIGEGIAGKVLSNGKVLMIPDYTHWEGRIKHFDPVIFRRVLGVPLKIGEQNIGVILVGDDHQVGSYSRDEIQLVSLFADQAAIAIENVRLMEAEHQRVEELDALRAMMAEISLELDLNTLLGTALERAVKLTGATGGELGLVIEKDQQIELVASYNMGRVMTGTRFKIGEGAMGKAVEELKEQVILDYAAWSERLPKYEGIPISAALAIPLMVGGRLVGVIGVFHADKSYQFSGSELNLLTLFGQQAAIAVENARLFGETRRLAQIDSLTGLYNRRHFYELARREFERARRYQHPLSAIMIDVDSFKQVNDRYGHSVGDKVLHAVAQNCLSYLRSVDVVARYGGEEFVALIPNTDLEGCLQMAERMRQCVASRKHLIGSEDLTITISLGIAELDPDCPNIDALLDLADKGLYVAKQRGKNQVAIWRGD